MLVIARRRSGDEYTIARTFDVEDAGLVISDDGIDHFDDDDVKEIVVIRDDDEWKD